MSDKILDKLIRKADGVSTVKGDALFAIGWEGDSLDSYRNLAEFNKDEDKCTPCDPVPDLRSLVKLVKHVNQEGNYERLLLVINKDNMRKRRKGR